MMSKNVSVCLRVSHILRPILCTQSLGTRLVFLMLLELLVILVFLMFM